jgi:hypothetical protein
MNATGTLNFTATTSYAFIGVHDSPQLEILYFPKLQTLSGLTITNAPALSQVLFPSLSDIPSLYLSVTDAPSLSGIDMPGTTEVESVRLFNVNVGAWEPFLYNVTQIHDVAQFDFCPYMANAISISKLTVSAKEPCLLQWPPLLASVTSVHFSNISYLFFGPATQDAVTINGSFELNDNSLYDFGDQISGQNHGLSGVKTDFRITSNRDSTLPLRYLEEVGEVFLISNNTNCTLNLPHLTTVGDLSIIDNMDNPIPSFPSLEQSTSIHLRGFIDP